MKEFWVYERQMKFWWGILSCCRNVWYVNWTDGWFSIASLLITFAGLLFEWLICSLERVRLVSFLWLYTSFRLRPVLLKNLFLVGQKILSTAVLISKLIAKWEIRNNNTTFLNIKKYLQCIPNHIIASYIKNEVSE